MCQRNVSNILLMFCFSSDKLATNQFLSWNILFFIHLIIINNNKKEQFENYCTAEVFQSIHSKILMICYVCPKIIKLKS